MTIETLFLFTVAMFTLAIIPGPGVLLVVSRALSGGFNHAIVATLGIVVADFIFLWFVVFGLQMIAESLSLVFVVIKYLGGAYLIWLGISLWRSPAHSLDTGKINKRQSQSYISDFISGIVITLSNPKAILFYLSFLPAFMDVTVLTLLDIGLIMAAIACALISTMLSYAFSALKAKQLVISKTSSAIPQKIAGGLMITTGGLLIAKS